MRVEALFAALPEIIRERLRTAPEFRALAERIRANYARVHGPAEPPPMTPPFPVCEKTLILEAELESVGLKNCYAALQLDWPADATPSHRLILALFRLRSALLLWSVGIYDVMLASTTVSRGSFMDDIYLDTALAAEYISCTPATLRTWRNRKKGPPYSMAGDKPVYRRSDIDAWLNASRISFDEVKRGAL